MRQLRAHETNGTELLDARPSNMATAKVEGCSFRLHLTSGPTHLHSRRADVVRPLTPIISIYRPFEYTSVECRRQGWTCQT